MITNERDQANIDNLTSLWKAMGGRPESLEAPAPVFVCDTWPHRCWCDWAAGEAAVPALRQALGALPAAGIVPVWGRPAERAAAMEELLTANRFAFRSAQTAMCLDREQCDGSGFGLSDGVVVDAGDDANIAAWTQVGSASFGYAIDPDAVRRVAADSGTTMLLLAHEGQPAATGLIYRTGAVAGVHQLGVPPEFRGKGLARILMHDMLARCLEMPINLITLQASAAGRGMYERLGFVEQFEIRNYRQSA